MEVCFAVCCGLDVHKKTVAACLRTPGRNGQRVAQVRTFATTTRALLELADWLVAAGCTHIAMESTGIYWRPVYQILEERMTVLLVNAAHVSKVPGRKTDVKDCEWIAELLEHGLLRGSFVPPAPLRELRELTRSRRQLIEIHSQAANRVQKVLETANIKLGDVATDVLGASGRAMLKALIAGERSATALAELAQGRLRDKRAALAEVLVGRFTDHHAFLLRICSLTSSFSNRRLEILIVGSLTPLRRWQPRLSTSTRFPVSVDAVRSKSSPNSATTCGSFPLPAMPHPGLEFVPAIMRAPASVDAPGRQKAIAGSGQPSWNVLAAPCASATAISRRSTGDSPNDVVTRRPLSRSAIQSWSPRGTFFGTASNIANSADSISIASTGSI
jgi:hypothetical protein